MVFSPKKMGRIIIVLKGDFGKMASQAGVKRLFHFEEEKTWVKRNFKVIRGNTNHHRLRTTGMGLGLKISYLENLMIHLIGFLKGLR